LHSDVSCTTSIALEQATINYTSGSILRGNKDRHLIIYLLHAFFIERLTYLFAFSSVARYSISDFSITSGQLLGFNSTLRGSYLHSFMNQYVYNSVIHEKGFDGLLLDNIRCSRFNFINLVIRNIYAFPEVGHMFEQINEFFANYQMNLGISICVSTKSILGVLLLLTHLQVALKVELYYDFL
jgi:ribosomal protein L5